MAADAKRGGGNERLQDDPGVPVVCTQIEIIRGIERRAERPMSIWHGRSISRHGHRSIAREGTAQRGNMDDALMIEHRR